MDLINNAILDFKKKSEENYVESPYFDNSISLDYDEYYSDSYNEIRRTKVILFSEIIYTIFKDIIDMKSIENICMLTKVKKVKNQLLSYLDDNTVNIILDYYSITHKIYNIAKKLEIGCLNQSIKKANKYNIRPIWEYEEFVLLYHDICYKVSINLDESSIIKSDYIKKRILSDNINLYKIATLTSKQLFPNKNKNIENKINKRTNVTINLKYSELYRCKKCKRNQTTTERRYNRSLDEGVNLTITCTFCKHQWNG
jgi:DNA-directed RNA polymerase subunit M/transcription elongation factor TFIIS